MKNRTGIDFSKHQHRVEIFKSKEGNEIRIDHLQIGQSNMKYLQFVNTDRNLVVTGDYGNWIFCRPFIPSEDGFVSDRYWIEKLRNSSEQKLEKVDLDECASQIKEMLKTNYFESYGYEGEELKQINEWFKELLEHTNDELDYLNFAYRDYEIPSSLDLETIPLVYETPIWLKIVFDGFDEICNRIKNKK